LSLDGQAGYPGGRLFGPDGVAHPGLENPVASVCDVCGKGPGFGMSVSHSHRRTRRRFNPNIQSVRAIVGRGTRRRMNVCTSCLKAGKVTR
jgi:large subunit ribosomal protein L28